MYIIEFTGFLSINLKFIDDKSYLLNYETQRQRHVVPTSAAIDGLQKLYSTDIPPVVLVRSLGLQLTNAMIPIKVRMSKLHTQNN